MPAAIAALVASQAPTPKKTSAKPSQIRTRALLRASLSSARSSAHAAPARRSDSSIVALMAAIVSSAGSLGPAPGAGASAAIVSMGASAAAQQARDQHAGRERDAECGERMLADLLGGRVAELLG